MYNLMDLNLTAVSILIWDESLSSSESGISIDLLGMTFILVLLRIRTPQNKKTYEKTKKN